MYKKQQSGENRRGFRPIKAIPYHRALMLELMQRELKAMAATMVAAEIILLFESPSSYFTFPLDPSSSV